MSNVESELMTLRTKMRLEESLISIQAKITEKTLATGQSDDNMGDWHDNGARDVLFQELQVLGNQEKTIQKYLLSPEIIVPLQDISTVGIGNTVDVLYEGEKNTERFTILGVPDTMTDDSWISYKTPLAQKLLGKHAGEQVIIPPNQVVTLVKILAGQF